MITTSELVGLTEDQRKQSAFKLGTVVELFESKAAKIQLDGEDAPSDKEYSYLASYTPQLNDRVLLANVGGTHIVLDAIYYKENPNESLSKLSGNISTINNNINTINGDIGTINSNIADLDSSVNIRVKSKMNDDVGGNMDVDYMYVDPATKNLHVRRKNGIFSSYYDYSNAVRKKYLYANKKIEYIYLDHLNNLYVKIEGGATIKFAPS